METECFFPSKERQRAVSRAIIWRSQWWIVGTALTVVGLVVGVALDISLFRKFGFGATLPETIVLVTLASAIPLIGFFISLYVAWNISPQSSLSDEIVRLEEKQLVYAYTTPDTQGHGFTMSVEQRVPFNKITFIEYSAENCCYVIHCDAASIMGYRLWGRAEPSPNRIILHDYFAGMPELLSLLSERSGVTVKQTQNTKN